MKTFNCKFKVTGPLSPATHADVHSLFKVGRHHKPLTITLSVNKVALPMELDTGSSSSFISESTYLSFFRYIPQQASNVTLKSYTGEFISFRGEINMFLEYADQSATLLLFVAQENGVTLLGRTWLEKIR
uniref:Peptidase A2 domain-containing protein n=1 Tax=Amphimedon queenslandica TaxID=400682 RepID=A0A1X7VFD9_AMPQE